MVLKINFSPHKLPYVQDFQYMNITQLHRNEENISSGFESVILLCNWSY